ncbi:FeoA family protein [Rhodovulum viride]|nr:FeoA family protein [Rhodovulum viride]
MSPAIHDQDAFDDRDSGDLQSSEAPGLADEGLMNGHGHEHRHRGGHRHRHGHDGLGTGECCHATGQPCTSPEARAADCVLGPNACPLALADEGVWLRVVALRPGRGVHHRLIDLGLTVGARVRILQRGGGCPMLIGVGETRLALGQGLAGKILVEPANDDH